MDYEKLNNIFGQGGNTSSSSSGGGGYNFSTLQNIDFSTPSQQASDEQKQKRNFEGSLVQPQSTANKPNILDQIGGFFSNLFKPAEPKPQTPKLTLPDNLKAKQTPQLDLKQVESTSAQLPQSYIPNTNLIDSVYNTLQSVPTFPDDAIRKIQDELGKPQNKTVLNALSFAQEKIIAPVINSTPLTRGFAKGVGDIYLGSSKEFQNTFNSKLDQPQDVGGKIAYTVGELTGNVAAFFAGGEILAGLKLGKLTLPTLFAVTGQTSASPDTTIGQRIEKVPVDAFAGWLFSKVPAAKKFLSADTLKQAGIGAGILSGQAFTDAMIQGLSKEEAAKVAVQMAVVAGLLHISFGAAGIVGRQLTESKIKEGRIEFTPEDAIRNVENSNLKGTSLGDEILKAATKAQAEGRNIQISGIAAKKSAVASAFKLNTPEGLAVKIDLVEPTTRLELINETGKPQTETGAAPKPTAPILSQLKQEAIQPTYSSAESFAKEKLGTGVGSLIGTIDSQKILARDPIDQGTVDEYKARIQAGEAIEPIVVREEAGQLLTTDGTQRATAYQQLGQDAPVIVTKFEKPIEGLQTVGDFYREAKVQGTENGVPSNQTVIPVQTQEPQTPLSTPIENAPVDIKAKEEELRTAYKAVDQTKVEEQLFEIFQELDAAEAGSRTVIREDGIATGEVIGSQSTFPKWVPEDLRSKELFQKMLEVISNGVDGFKYPEGIASKQRHLLDVIFRELDARLNIDTSNIRADIIKGYEESTNKGNAASNDRGVKGNKRPAKKPTTEAIKETVNTSTSKATKGVFADIPETQATFDKINPIDMPEMVKLAKDLLGGQYPEVKKKLWGALGLTSLPQGQGEARIRLLSDIFKDPYQASRVLAHEIGHLIDWLPDKISTRGNLVGRIASLKKNLKHLYGELDNKVVKKELMDFSALWRPLPTDKKGNPVWSAYRKQPDELYADAISGLFNNPGLLQEKAPEFYKSFFDYLDRKPQVKEEFFDLQNLLNRGEEEVLSEREKSIREMFRKGEDLFKVKIEEQKKKDRDYLFRLRYELIDRNQKVIDLVNQAKKEGKLVSDDDNPVYWLESHNYVGGLVKNWVETGIQPIYKRLGEAGVTWEDFGEVLFLERVLNDRSEMANPLGFTPKTAGQQLEFLKKQLGEDKVKLIQDELPKFRDAIKKIMDSDGAKEFYNPELLQSIKDNPAYATYQVLDYFDTNLPASIKHQVGTLKEISNPATSTIVKTISIIKAIERNQTKGKIVKFLKNNFTKEIEPAKTIWNGKSHVPIDPQERGQELFTVMEQGKYIGYYVDPYIASTMERMTIGHGNAVIETFRFFNSKVFRPAFITFNLGFQTFNLARDFIRAYKNLPTYNILAVINEYRKAVPAAYARAFDLPNKTIAEMEKAKILNITFNDIVSGLTDEDKQIDAIIAKVGASPLKGKKTNFFIRPFKAVLDTIEKTGNFIETLPKVAGYNILNGKLPNQELASFIRTSIGSPDFLRKGAGYRWYNEVFLFSNAIKEGVRADFNIAFKNPETRSGYWWKTIVLSFLPKLIMFAAGIGLFGANLKKMLDNVSEYDRANYTIIPLSLDSGKTVYLRIPQDETGRVYGALLWKILNITKNEQNIPQNLADLLATTGGQLPNISPSITTLFAITQFMAGQNPYDFFRGRNVIPDTEFKAGGQYALKPFIAWTFNNVGGNVIMRLPVTEQAPTSKTWYQKVLDAPLASNILGRWIKVSDYGQKEDNIKIQQQIQTQSAQRSIQQKELVNSYIKEWQSSDKSESKKKDLVDRFVNQTVDAADREDKAQQAGIARRKIRLALAKGEYDINTDSLISATTNDTKVKILQKVKTEMSADQFKDYKKLLLKEGIVSGAVISELDR